MLPQHHPVIIAGGGPCGLMLANELGRRGNDASQAEYALARMTGREP